MVDRRVNSQQSGARIVNPLLTNGNGNEAQMDIIRGPFEGTTSSIGSVEWPPRAGASFDRYKGMYGDVVDTWDQIDEIDSVLRGLNLNGRDTRVSVRAVVDEKLFPHLVTRSHNMIETVIPLAGTGVPSLNDSLLVYLGRNDEGREPDNGYETWRTADEIFKTRSQGITPPVVLKPDYHVAPISFEQREDATIQAAYINLYKLFGWTEQEVLELLRNPQNLIIAGFHKGNVVASGLAESGTIPIARGNETVDLRVAEITEAATHVDHRGAGLYKAISRALLGHLAGLPKDQRPNLVYGEMNAESPAVLKTAAGQGRLTGLDTAVGYGVPHAWRLPQHVTIDSGNAETRRTKYNDLIVGWLPQEMLQAFA